MFARPGVVTYQAACRRRAPSSPRSNNAIDTLVPATTKWPSSKVDIRFGSFQSLCGDALALLDDRFGRTPDRRAAHVGCARTAMAAAVRDQIGVALAQPDDIVRQPKPIRQDLRECRFVTLTDGLRTRDQRHGAVRFEADVDILVRRATGGLDVISEAEAPQKAARFTLAATRRKIRDVRPQRAHGRTSPRNSRCPRRSPMRWSSASHPRGPCCVDANRRGRNHIAARRRRSAAR